MRDFWSRLWSSRQARRITVFQWLVAHRAVAVGLWLAFGGLLVSCPRCGYETESQRHCLWDYPHAQHIWLRVLKLVAALSTSEFFSWGIAAWSTTSGPALQFEADPGSPRYRIQAGQVHRQSGPFSASRVWTGQRDQVWELINSLSLWFTWRARCTTVFEGRQEPPTETVWAIWLEHVHILRG